MVWGWVFLVYCLVWTKDCLILFNWQTLQMLREIGKEILDARIAV